MRWISSEVSRNEKELTCCHGESSDGGIRNVCTLFLIRVFFTKSNCPPKFEGISDFPYLLLRDQVQTYHRLQHRWHASKNYDSCKVNTALSRWLSPVSSCRRRRSFWAMSYCRMQSMHACSGVAEEEREKDPRSKHNNPEMRNMPVQ